MEAVLSVKNAWNSVALEERLELISRAKAEGLVAGLCFVLFAGSIGYGFDKIYFLYGGVLGSLFIAQLFSFYSWRRNKPEAILKYLAARSVARRYAYGYRLHDLDVILIFRGVFELKYADAEEQAIMESTEEISFSSTVKAQKAVWICLMRGAVVVMSERPGGAKLEFITPIMAETDLRVREDEDRTLEVIGCGPTKGKRAELTSSYKAAMYVFEKQLEKLIEEQRRKLDALERI